MTVSRQLLRVIEQEDINFLLTNRIPRRALTRFVGWFSKIEQPLVRDLSIALWRAASGLDLSEAKKSAFQSMHECFTRELKDGARPIDMEPSVVVSPCDAIVGTWGRIEDTELYQVKGFPYALGDLLCRPELEKRHRHGIYVTLRLTSAMYHRFHAPHDSRIRRVSYLSGDTWNVNPIALKRVEKLFCKNERAIIETWLAATDQPVTLVAVAAIAVASIRLHFADVLLHLRYRGPNVIPCDTEVKKGQELGWFEHGSTIIVFAPREFRFSDLVREGATIKMGQPLMRLF